MPETRPTRRPTGVNTRSAAASTPPGPPTRTRAPGRPTGHPAQRTRHPRFGPADAVREGARLTDRDHLLIGLLAAHRAMTTDQLTRLVFPSTPRARQRLRLLTERGILARFRHYRPLGSLPWTYTLGYVGALIHAARTDTPFPTAAQLHARITRLHHAPSLRHLLEVNDFFTRLHATAQTTPGAALITWWPETTTTAECGGIIRPDGYGEWTQPHPTTGQPLTFGFFYEHDRGTEQLDILLGKINRYEQLAATNITRPVLIHLPNRAREISLHRLIRRHYGQRGPHPVPIATAHNLTNVPTTTPATVIEHGPTTRHPRPAVRPGVPNSPTGPVWLPFGATTRHGLATLATLHPLDMPQDSRRNG